MELAIGLFVFSSFGFAGLGWWAHATVTAYRDEVAKARQDLDHIEWHIDKWRKR